jgi:hypothetical protein
MPQKSPTFFHSASGDIDDVIVTLDSKAQAETVDMPRTAIAARTVQRINPLPVLSLEYVSI